MQECSALEPDIACYPMVAGLPVRRARWLDNPEGSLRVVGEPVRGGLKL